MLRIIAPATALTALLAAISHSPPAAAEGAFLFPHIDMQQPTAPPDSLSFGTLLDSSPAGVAALEQIPEDLFYSALAADDPLTDLLQAGRIGTAVRLARTRLEQREGQNLALPVAKARIDLGIALYLDGQHGHAAVALERGLTVARPSQGWFDQRWVGPLLALGLAQQTLGRHDEADRSLTRAQNLLQRGFGATDSRQLPLLLARARSQDALNEDFETEQLFRTHLKLIKKHTSPLSGQRVAAAYVLTEWLVDRGDFKDAISIWNELLDEQGQETDAADSGPGIQARVAAMTALSQVFLRTGGLEVDRGLSLARQAATLVDKNPAAFEPAQAAAVYLYAGDWLTLFGRRRQAAQQYRQAWEKAGESPEAEKLHARLREPALIFDGPEIPLADMGYQWAYDHAFANFELTVRPDGRPARVHLTGTNLHATNIRLAQQLLRKARFRPALEDGVPVSTKKLRHHRVYITEPFAGFGEVQAGGARIGGFSDR